MQRSLDSALRAPDPRHLDAVLRGAAEAEERARRRVIERAREERARIEALGGGASAMQGARRYRDLAVRIRSILALAGWHLFFLGLARGAHDFTLSGSEVTAWIDRSGNGNHATQGTSTARPTYSATAINGRPGITLDGGDQLVTAALDASAYNAGALILAGQVTNTAEPFDFAFPDTGSLFLSTDSTNQYVQSATFNAGLNQARSSLGGYAGDARVITATGDFAIANETEIRIDGVNATASRPSTTNNTGTLRSAGILSIGARRNGTSKMVGALTAAVFAATSSTISGAKLTALAEVEGILLEEML